MNSIDHVRAPKAGSHLTAKQEINMNLISIRQVLKKAFSESLRGNINDGILEILTMAFY